MSTCSTGGNLTYSHGSLFLGSTNTNVTKEDIPFGDGLPVIYITHW